MMDNAGLQNQRRNELIQSIIDAGTRAFHPGARGNPQGGALREFEDLTKR